MDLQLHATHHRRDGLHRFLTKMRLLRVTSKNHHLFFRRNKTKIFTYRPVYTITNNYPWLPRLTTVRREKSYRTVIRPEVPRPSKYRIWDSEETIIRKRTVWDSNGHPTQYATVIIRNEDTEENTRFDDVKETEEKEEEMSQEMGLIEKDTEENTRFDDVKETEEKEEEMSQEMGLIEKDTEENTRFDDVKETEEKEEEMSQEMGLIEKDTEENTRFDEETEEKEEEMSQEMGVIEKDTEENTGFDEETEEEEEEHRKRMEVIVNIIENSMEDGKEDHEEEEEDIDQRLRDEYDNSWEDPSYQPGKDEGGGPVTRRGMVKKNKKKRIEKEERKQRKMEKKEKRGEKQKRK